jgi:hypothetical protein
MYTECVGAFSNTHNTVILVMKAAKDGPSNSQMRLLQETSNPNITPVEETDKYKHKHNHIK